jgi:hypothetical protein
MRRSHLVHTHSHTRAERDERTETHTEGKKGRTSAINSTRGKEEPFAPKRHGACVRRILRPCPRPNGLGRAEIASPASLRTRSPRPRSVPAASRRRLHLSPGPVRRTLGNAPPSCTLRVAAACARNARGNDERGRRSRVSDGVSWIVHPGEGMRRCIRRRNRVDDT